MIGVEWENRKDRHSDSGPHALDVGKGLCLILHHSKTEFACASLSSIFLILLEYVKVYNITILTKYIYILMYIYPPSPAIPNRKHVDPVS